MRRKLIENQKPNRKNIEAFQRSLLQWYQKNKRTMPWRDIENPYYTWVSEIMLQQTRVDTVIPYFLRFIEKYPTVKDLAKGEDEDLLKLWEGLGYYSRVKNMKIAAREVVEKYDGVFPKERKALESLKGIGEYTAGAIASIAYEQKEPAVDGNVLRVMTRITGNHGDIKLGKTKKEITHGVRKLLPEENLGDFNQGLIELGAVLCTTAKAPDCEICPVSEFCLAFEKNLQGALPVKGKAMKKRLEKKTVLIFTYKEQLFLRKREERGLLAGLWEFPNIKGHIKEEALKEILEKEQHLAEENLTVENITRLEDSKAVFSHIQWNLMAYQVNLKSSEGPPEGLRIKEDKNYLELPVEEVMDNGRWIPREEVRKDYSIASAFKAYRKEVL
ncbi:A/G-specific adenine glycosylase [Isachenkonia alkalipeptolytica]|uniref:Adenine DNA glycosylase n=1 Tax=Isachenkonia alkalipeptolytica TaxID=2565777 RepID=A0AA43XJX5_9CLOT|nr:A/G-specific adenine glycosylase [Isachenkonia alkalipeptolytica]NBG87260.1 A/G-specific adenine glycosylase [Isachenkonia alkalipeptolytica]